jgi:hypothetical protein
VSLNYLDSRAERADHESDAPEISFRESSIATASMTVSGADEVCSASTGDSILVVLREVVVQSKNSLLVQLDIPDPTIYPL